MNGDEYTCACGHGWHRHGPEVPGCCECRCGQLVEGRIVIDPSDSELRQTLARALQYRAERDPRGPVRHYGDFADAVIAALIGLTQCARTTDGWCATHSTSAGPVRCTDEVTA